MKTAHTDATILIVDDNATNLGVLTGYLRGHGFQLMVARNGRDGVDKARRGQPDLILLDVMMPDIDGFETCRRLKTEAETVEIPVIFITALQGVEDKIKGFSAGGVDYITKPLQEEEVLARVQTHVQLRQQKKQLQQEIAGRKQAVEALRESEQRFRDLVTNLPGIVFQFYARPDGSMGFYYISPKDENSYFADLAAPDWELGSRIHPEDRAALMKSVQHAIHTASAWEFEGRFVDKHGEVRWFHGIASPVARENEIVFNGVLFDITERKQTETALHENEARLKIAMDTLHAGVWEHDLITGQAIWDERTYHLFGEPPSDTPVMIEDIFSSIHPEDRTAAQLTYQQALAAKDTAEMEYRIIWPDNTLHWIYAAGQIFRNDAGHATRIVGINFDITGRKQSEKDLQQAKDAAEAANRAKSAFLANMSHELRTPLNGILGYAQVLKRDPAVTEHKYQQIDVIERSGHHLLDLINDILDLAKVESGKLELSLTDFDVPAFLHNINALIQVRAERKSLAFRLEQSDSLPAYLRGDEQRLRQVLLNLLGNAVKFTDQGEISLRVSELEELHELHRSQTSIPITSPIPKLTNSPIQKLTNSKTHILRFEVHDSGVGIAPEELAAIFEPFQQVGDTTRRQEGTGLGLSISCKLIQLMGGELSVKSIPGEGSTFWFDVVLPEASIEDVAVTEQSRKILGIDGKAPSVLVVDDHLDSRDLVICLLVPLGFEILEACNGQEALTKITAHHPDCIITDIMMPDMDGLELIRQIRQTPDVQAVVIIATSARVYEEDRQRCIAAGSNDFLPKPIQAEVLFSQLQRHLALTWRYLEDEPEAGGMTTTVGPAILPPPEVIETLLHFTIIGDIMAIKQFLDTLEQTDSQLQWFVARVRQMAIRFHIDDIRQFLTSCKQQLGKGAPNGCILSELAKLPPELLDEFEQATICSDITNMESLIDCLRQEHPLVARALAELAYDFEYQKILEMVRKGRERQ